MSTGSNQMKYIKVRKYDKEEANLAYVAGISILGMAFKMSLANIDIADALIVEKEAMNLTLSCSKYFNQLNSLMLMKISCTAVNMSKNLDKYPTGIRSISF